MKYLKILAKKNLSSWLLFIGYCFAFLVLMEGIFSAREWHVKARVRPDKEKHGEARKDNMRQQKRRQECDENKKRKNMVIQKQLRIDQEKCR